MSVIAFKQRLKEISSEEFENLCFSTVCARHPEHRIQKVDGTGGDKGIDFFSGTLDAKLTIWQAKYFKDGIHSSQKRKIEASLKTALKNYKPIRWILCVPIDLDIRAREWFEHLANEHSLACDLGLFQAADICNALVSRPELAETYFPDIFRSPTRLKALLLGLEKKSDEQLGTLADEYSSQYIAKLADKDARFRYQLRYGLDAPSAFSNASNRPLLTVFDGSKAIDVFPRDFEALRLSPPGMVWKVANSALPRLERALAKGVKETFTSDEIGIVKSSFSFLGLSPEFSGTVTLETLLDEKSWFLRLIARSATKSKELFRRYRQVRKGWKEAEFKTEGDPPVEINFVLSTDGSVEFSIELDLVDKRASEVEDGLDLIQILADGGTLELVDVENSRSFGAASVKLSNELSEVPIFQRLLISDLAFIEKAIGLELLVPAAVTKKELEDIDLVANGLRNGSVEVNVNDLRGQLVRPEGDPEIVLNLLREGSQLALEHAHYQLSFGNSSIDVGPVVIVMSSVTVNDYNSVARKFRVAVPGDAIPVSFKAHDQTKIIFKRNQSEDNTAAKKATP